MSNLVTLLTLNVKILCQILNIKPNQPHSNSFHHHPLHFITFHHNLSRVPLNNIYDLFISNKIDRNRSSSALTITYRIWTFSPCFVCLLFYCFFFRTTYPDLYRRELVRPINKNRPQNPTTSLDKCSRLSFLSIGALLSYSLRLL